MPLVAITDDAGRQIVIDPLTGQFQQTATEEIDEGEVGGDEEGGPPTLPAGFTPKGRIDQIFNVPGVGTVVQYVGGITPDVIPSAPKSPTALSPNTVYTQQQVAARDAAQREAQSAQQQASIAEQQRQFNETFGANKAEFNIRQNESTRQFNERLGLEREQLDVSRGNKLLELGSRPDTLIRYLHAIRGQQAPQGLGTPPSLPGYPGTAAYPTAAAPALGATAPAITSAPAPLVQQFNPTGAAPESLPSIDTLPKDQRAAYARAAFPQNFAPAQATASPIVEPPPSIVNPAHLSPTLQPVAQSVQFAPSGAQLGNRVDDENDALNQIRSREQYNAYQRSIGGKEAASLKYDPSVGRLYGKGGVIPEMVVGMGMDSGQQYVFGEEGREVVVPEKKVPKDIFEDLMQDAEEIDYSEDKAGKRHVKVKRGMGMNSYAEGGPLGYKPIDPKVFNPPAISNDFNFPQIGNFTGGTSLVPSAQRLFDALPSERALFSGYLRDEVGAQSEDVFEMARRLAPKATGLNAGRFVN